MATPKTSRPLTEGDPLTPLDEANERYAAAVEAARKRRDDELGVLAELCCYRGRSEASVAVDLGVSSEAVAKRLRPYLEKHRLRLNDPAQRTRYVRPHRHLADPSVSALLLEVHEDIGRLDREADEAYGAVVRVASGLVIDGGHSINRLAKRIGGGKRSDRLRQALNAYWARAGIEPARPAHFRRSGRW